MNISLKIINIFLIFLKEIGKNYGSIVREILRIRKKYKKDERSEKDTEKYCGRNKLY